MAIDATSDINRVINVDLERYDIQERWLNDIAPKYLDINNINRLKVGLFGYLNEIMSTELRNSVYHRNFLYDEAFLNTASLTRSIYNKAKSYNYEIPLATPSNCNLVMGIKASDLLKYSKLNENEKILVYTIPKEANYKLGKYNFMSEFDINIYSKKLSDGTYAYSAKYDFKGQTSSYFDNTLRYPNLTIYKDVYDGIEYVYFIFKVYQMTRAEKIFENYSSNLSDNLSFDVSYSNYLTKFDVYYTSLGTTYKLDGFFNNTFTPDSEKYYYYSYLNNKLNIYFSMLPGAFKPAINTRLTIESYTTLGSAGNTIYTGDIKISSKLDYIKRTSFLIKMQSTTTTGGTDAPSMMQIKKDLIDQFLTRDNLITEYDLNYFFNNLIKAESVNNSRLLFIKKRDDVLKRLFGGYILLRDSNSRIVPTNTIDIDIEGQFTKDVMYPAGIEFESYTYHYVEYDERKFTPDKIIKFDNDNTNYVKYDPETMDKDEFEILSRCRYTLFDSKKEKDPNKFYYRLPFMIQYKVAPFPRTVVIANTINVTNTFDYSDVNASVTYDFLITGGMEIRRDSIEFFNEGNEVAEEKEFHKKLFFTFSLETNMPEEKFVDKGSVDVAPSLNGTLLVRCVLREPIENEPIGYFDFNFNGKEKLIFYKEITSNDKLDNKNRMEFSNSLRNITTGKIMEKSYLNERMNLDIYFLIKDETSEMKHDEVISLMPDTRNYTIAARMTNSNPTPIFNILNDLMRPDLVMHPNYFPEGVVLKAVPVIGSHYLQTYNIYQDFFRTFSIYNTVMKNNFDKLENNTSVDIKFYNTYGHSEHFNTDNIATRISLTIKLNDTYTRDLDTSIKEYILDFVEAVNETNNKTFAISNLIRGLERNFNDIEYVIFNSLNGTEDQVILNQYPKISELTKEQLINYIPEYLNIYIDTSAYLSNNTEDFKTGIDIKYI